MTSKQRAYLKSLAMDQSAILQIVGDVAAHDTESKPLGNCGFADAGFTDQNRVVLRFSGKNPNHVTDFKIGRAHV